MNSLPDSYYGSVIAFFILLAYAASRWRKPWAMPYAGVLCMIAAWYLVEPLYNEEFFWVIDQNYLQPAFDCVLIFFVSFALATPLMVRVLVPVPSQRGLSDFSISAEQLLLTVAAVWLVLLAYGTFRAGGDLITSLFPIQARSGGGTMWSRAAGAGAGSDGFIVSAASYGYLLCLSAFGLLLPLLGRGGCRRLALLLIAISWPYAVLQGSRNVTLATIVPAIFSYLLFSKQPVVIKAVFIAGMGLALELILRIIIEYRNVGFGDIQLDGVNRTQHLGLNMASELVYCVQFVSEGILPIKYGFGYLAELANVIPRAIWADKPLVGIDFALMRGFASENADIGVFATISTGAIGGGVLNFGTILGPIIAGLLMSTWVAILTRFRVQGTPLRLGLFLIGLGLTFNLGRDITLLVLWPLVFGYIGVRVLESYAQKTCPSGESPTAHDLTRPAARGSIHLTPSGVQRTRRGAR